MFVLSFITYGAVVVAVFRSHGQASAAVTVAGLEAIVNLSVGINAANRTRLGEAGACKGVWTRSTAVWLCFKFS